MARTAGRSALRLVEGYRAPPTKIGACLTSVHNGSASAVKWRNDRSADPLT
jgi:hypothetical protein